LTVIVWALALFALVWFLVAALWEWSLVPGLVLLTLSVGVLGHISRRYITRLQDRIIRLEMRSRCRELMGPERAAALDKLRSSQVVALRFASDEELPALMDRAAAEALSADQIKRAIKNWRADWYRT
jgi:uncharacterized protein DUF6526